MYNSEEQALSLLSKPSRRHSKCFTLRKKQNISVSYIVSPTSGVTVLCQLCFPELKAIHQARPLCHCQFWVMIRKEHTPKKETHTYPLACQWPLRKSVLRQHHHSLVGCMPCSRKEGDMRGRSRPKHSYTTWHLTDEGTKGRRG